MLEPHKDALLIEKNDGPNVLLSVQLGTDDSHWSFQDELTAFLSLLFERWCPSGPNQQPLTHPGTLAETLSPTWSGESPKLTPIGAITGSPWLRLDPDTWPVNILDEQGHAHSVEAWPSHDSARHDAPRWIRLKTRTPTLVDLRIRADGNTPGLIHAEIAVHVDLYSPSQGRELSEELVERCGGHLLGLTQWIEDMAVLYQPEVFEITGPSILSGATLSIQGASSGQRVATRLLARTHDLHAQTGKNPSANPERLRSLNIWMERIQFVEAPPHEWINARSILDGLSGE